jgi:hypothetical protein
MSYTQSMSPIARRSRGLCSGKHLQRGADRPRDSQVVRRPALGRFRRIDLKEALRADLNIAVSQVVQQRIRAVYGNRCSRAAASGRPRLVPSDSA